MSLNRMLAAPAVALALVLALTGAATLAQEAVPGVPDAAAALAAYADFAADPPARLGATQPFLDFIRGSGQVHIVLNDGLLGWMYDDALAPERKAVLYAAFLGANMAAQLERGEAGSDDVAGMTGALAAYRRLRAGDADFTLPLFEQLEGADRDGHLDAAIRRLAGADDGAAP